jgi:hypothetical protein
MRIRLTTATIGTGGTHHDASRRPARAATQLAVTLAMLAATAGPAFAGQLTAGYRVFLSSTQNSEEVDTLDFCASGAGCAVVGNNPSARVLFDQDGQYAAARSRPGLLGVRAEAAWPASTFTPFFATAEASISDSFTLTGGDGAPDTIARLQFFIDGELDYTTNGLASMYTRVRLTGDGVFYSELFQANASAAGTVIDVGDWGVLGPESSQLGTPFGLFDLYVRLPIGKAITFDWILGVEASPDPGANDGRSGTAAARLDQTAGWLGIDFLDGNLQPVTGIQLVSTGGYDWSTATVVPVPPAAWLLMSGLAG